MNGNLVISLSKENTMIEKSVQHKKYKSRKQVHYAYYHTLNGKRRLKIK